MCYVFALLSHQTPQRKSLWGILTFRGIPSVIFHQKMSQKCIGNGSHICSYFLSYNTRFVVKAMMRGGLFLIWNNVVSIFFASCQMGNNNSLSWFNIIILDSTGNTAAANTLRLSGPVHQNAFHEVSRSQASKPDSQRAVEGTYLFWSH